MADRLAKFRKENDRDRLAPMAGHNVQVGVRPNTPQSIYDPNSPTGRAATNMNANAAGAMRAATAVPAVRRLMDAPGKIRQAYTDEGGGLGGAGAAVGATLRETGGLAADIYDTPKGVALPVTDVLSGFMRGAGGTTGAETAATTAPPPPVQGDPTANMTPTDRAAYWEDQGIGGNAGFADQQVIQYDTGRGQSGAYLNPANPENQADLARQNAAFEARPVGMRGAVAPEATPSAEVIRGGVTERARAPEDTDIVTTESGRQIYFGGRVPVYSQGPAEYHPVTGAKIGTGQNITGYRSVWKDLQTGEQFGSRAEAEAGSPIDVVQGRSAAALDTATAGLRRTEAEMMPEDVRSQIGYRGALGEAALTTAETGRRTAEAAAAAPRGSARAPRTFTQKVASTLTGSEFNREYVEQPQAGGGIRYVPVSETIPQEQLRTNNLTLLRQLSNIDPDKASIVERRFEGVNPENIDQSLLYDELQSMVTNAQLSAR